MMGSAASGYAARALLPAHVRATEIGTAAEHLVVADLLLAGCRAFMAGAQLPYDVVVDDAGRLLRIGVKACQIATRRPAREKSRLCYQFTAQRNSRLASGKTVVRPYTAAEIDLMAFVALDVRQIAYARMREGFPSVWHIDPPGAYVPSASGSGPVNPRATRKTFERFTFSKAMEAVVP